MVTLRVVSFMINWDFNLPQYQVLSFIPIIIRSLPWGLNPSLWHSCKLLGFTPYHSFVIGVSQTLMHAWGILCWFWCIIWHGKYKHKKLEVRILSSWQLKYKVKLYIIALDKIWIFLSYVHYILLLFFWRGGG